MVVPGDTPLAVAFVMPQDVRGDESLRRYLVSIDEVEAKTGLNFLPRLPASQEADWESVAGVGDWALSQVAELPSRFD